MMQNILPPPALQGDERAQLTQVYRYLFRLSEQLNVGLSALEQRTAAVARPSGGALSPEGAAGEQFWTEADAQYSSLKSLIIKTANLVRAEMDQIVTNLGSEYVAVSEWGTYKEEVSREIVDTAKYTMENFEYNEEILNIPEMAAIFDSYRIETTGYIKRGIIGFDEENYPILGIAIGQELKHKEVTVGGEVYEVFDESQNMATYAADKLSFWVNGVEVAYLSNSELVVTRIIVSDSIQLGNWDIAVNAADGMTVQKRIGSELDLSENNTFTITADKINAVADQIDLSGNTSIVLTAAQVNAVADQIDLNGNTSIQIMAGQVKQNTQDIANQAQDFASTVTRIDADMESLQGQIDGSITTWFYEVAPTNENEPAVNWTSTDEKNLHLGDLYYDTVTGYCYRWQVQNNAYSWQRITDTDVTKALSDAASAQDTADAKRRVFVSTPVPPYDVGDLWVQGDGGDILRCNAQKISGQSYAAGDWVKASKYTDDTTANQALTLAGGGVASADVEFYLSTSATTLSGGSWQTVAPEWVDGKYMWMRVKTTLKDGTERTSDPTCIAGATGATGATGPQGVSITAVTEEYYLSTSKTSPTGGNWQSTQPAWMMGTYVWTRVKISYNNGNVSYTEPYCDTSWEVVNDVSIYTGAEPPEAPVPDGKLWVDTAQDPNVIRRWLGQNVSTERDYTASASGNPVETPPGTASFDSIQSVLLPVQAGSGDPSPDNIRPISGRTVAMLTRCGKNLMDLSQGYGYGELKPLNAPVGTPITFSLFPTDGTSQFNGRIVYDDDTTHDFAIIGTNADNNIWHTYTITPEKHIKEYSIYDTDGSSIRTISKGMIEYGSTATTFEPYQGDTYTADFGQTVYGGTLDWQTGVLTVDREMLEFNGTENWNDNTPYFSLPSTYSFGYDEPCISSHLKTVTWIEGDGGELGINITIYIRAYVTSMFPTVEDWKSYLAAQYAAGTPVQIVYKLATPTTIQLSPVTVAALKGVNTLHTDADSVSVAYTASGWEIVNDLSEINDVSNRLLAQQAAAQQAIDQLATAITVDSDGAHFYKPGYRAQNEVRIDQDSVDILVGGSVNSSFVAGGLILGNYMLWHPEAAGGLAFNLI